MTAKHVIAELKYTSGDVFGIWEFISMAKAGTVIDTDGIGYYATDTHETNRQILPSDAKAGKVNFDYHKVVWYNK